MLTSIGRRRCTPSPLLSQQSTGGAYAIPRSLPLRYFLCILLLYPGCIPFGHALYYEGEQQLRNQEYAAAYTTFSRFLVLHPNAAGAYYNRGTAAAGLGMLTEAALDLDRAIELNPGDYDAYWMRYRIRGGIREALTDTAAKGPFERPMIEGRRHALTVLMLEDLTTMLKIEPDNVGARGERGVLLQTLGRYDEAQRDLDIALVEDPWDFWLRNERGRLRHALGDYEGAVHDYTIAFASCDTCTWVLYNKALSLKAGGWPAKAAETLRDLVNLDSLDGEAWFMLGECEIQSGRPDSGCSALKRSLGLGIDEARPLLDSLCR